MGTIHENKQMLFDKGSFHKSNKRLHYLPPCALQNTNVTIHFIFKKTPGRNNVYM